MLTNNKAPCLGVGAALVDNVDKGLCSSFAKFGRRFLLSEKSG
jgi:hypothetical protein